MTLIIVVILVALAFEFINGFHDTANSIATVVSTKVLTPRQAIVLDRGRIVHRSDSETLLRDPDKLRRLVTVG